MRAVHATTVAKVSASEMPASGVRSSRLRRRSLTGLVGLLCGLLASEAWAAEDKQADAPAKSDAAKDDGKGKAAPKDDAKSDKAETKSDAKAEPDGKEPGPGAGAGQRRIEPDAKVDPKPGAKDAKPEAKDAPKPEADRAAKTHQRGPAPRKPNPKLPSDEPRSEANPAVRRAIAEGPVDDEEAEIDDEQIRALVDADRVLFPRPLVGATPGWTWGLPQKTAPRSGGSGLPPQAGLTTPKKDEGSKRAAWLRQLSMPNFDVRLDPRVVKYLEFYKTNPRGQAIARVWAKKSGRFAPAIQAELAKAGLPTDLVWLSLIESGHNPTIYSSAGAAGLWQFIPDSGRIYGLTVDRWVDERLDPQRATEAAIKYLSDLHTRFGNWELAMAAYNMGHGGLSRAIRKYNTNDYWELSRYEAGIPWETTLYVPKIAAIAIVMNNKRVFGLEDVKPDPAESFDTVSVPAGVSLEQVAAVTGLTKQRVQELNPHYLAGRVPPPGDEKAPASWRLRVPRGEGVRARQGLAKIAKIDSKLEPYVVRFGDTVEAIAAEHPGSEYSLRKTNAIGRNERLEAGTVLLVQKGAAPPQPKGDADVAVVPPRPFNYKGRQRVFYRTLPSDSVEAVASHFEVTRAEVIAWNGLDTSARLLSGMVLQLFVKPAFDLGRVRLVDAPKILVAGSEEFFEHFEAKNGRKRIRVTVRAGDSLWKIAKRYGMSVGMMERINRISRNKQLQVGDTLIVYAKAVDKVTDDKEEGDAKREPLPEVKPPEPDSLPGGAKGTPSADK
ncbi:MAG: transglycosylase SLT domain-containing protein [Polyangiaceae bacterium]